MTRPPFTPGPLRVEYSGFKGDVFVVRDSRGHEVAHVFALDEGDVSIAEAEADAKLFAAAPDYWTATEEVARVAVQHMQRDIYRIPVDLRDALLKLADAHCKANHPPEGE